MTIGFLGFWYQNPSGLGFQYKLDGYDIDWINTGVKHMKLSAERLDDVVRSITGSIEKGDGYEGFDEKDDDEID